VTEGQLAHDVHGPAEAPVVVLGSSLGTDRTMWDEQLPALAERFRVVRYDHPGHGDSPLRGRPVTVADLGAGVLALMDELGVDRAHQVGLSLGGAVAQWLAVHQSRRVDRLALVCTAADFSPAQRWRDRAAAVRGQGTTSLVESTRGRWFTAAFDDVARQQELLDRLQGTTDAGYAACCEALASFDLRGELGQVRAPTLVISGRDDPATPPARGEELVAGIREGGGSARLEVVPGAHLASVESAETVTGLLLEHLGAEDGSVA